MCTSCSLSMVHEIPRGTVLFVTVPGSVCAVVPDDS